jgi:SAM-dependent methyltransferase
VPEVLERLGMLGAGHRGLGFGVGRERLVPAFAARGIEVVATDLEPESREMMGWIRSDQHAYGAESMQRPEICEPETFRRLASWRAVDMRAIPGDLTGFDFCWSVCSLEHLGSLDYGLEFIERSLDTLRPGGIAVHTTEYNLTSNEAAVEAGPTVVYRERDMAALVARLESQGHEVAALDLRPGEGLLDRYAPPYADEPCLRLLFAPYTLTSVALVIRTRGA